MRKETLTRERISRSFGSDGAANKIPQASALSLGCFGALGFTEGEVAFWVFLYLTNYFFFFAA